MANMRRFPGRVRKPASKLPIVSDQSAAVPLAPLSSRDRILIWCCLVAIVALAWVYLLYLDSQMAPSMEQGMAMADADMPVLPPWRMADFFFTFAMWVVMMTGMMAASAAPVILLFAGAHARRGGRRLPLIVLSFGLGYAVVWIGFSACATLVQGALHQNAMLSPAMATSSVYASGAILCAAGLYQFTPLKRACLVHCQSPLGFLMTHWRDGELGALQMGMRHGAYCLGCCWALMGILFVVGVMSLVWVAALTLLVLLEKTGPAGSVLARMAGVVMIAFGVLLFAGGP
jgi:predicted metal-binding membrane protein